MSISSAERRLIIGAVRIERWVEKHLYTKNRSFVRKELPAKVSCLNYDLFWVLLENNGCHNLIQ